MITYLLPLVIAGVVYVECRLLAAYGRRHPVSETSDTP